VGFSSLIDPDDIARAQSALDSAWTRVVAKGLVRGSDDVQQARLAQIVGELVLVGKDGDELISLAVRRFIESQRF
jgi:hypothetical protein